MYTNIPAAGFKQQIMKIVLTRVMQENSARGITMRIPEALCLPAGNQTDMFAEEGQ